MTFGETVRKRLHCLFLLIAALALFPVSHAANAAPAPAATTAATAPAPAASAAAPTQAATAAKGDYKPLGREWIKGVPEAGAYWFQPQYTDDGRYAKRFHNAILMPVITAISLLVLVLLLWVIARYRRSANPVPSRTSHNTLLEVAWTVVPAIILIVIAVPSMILLNRQYRTPPKDALTVKVTGYQWYWGYTYPDNGGFEVISNMLKEQGEVKAGERYRTDADGPAHLAADTRMVVPVGVPIRLQTTGADVIHSFAVPSLWFKLDAVPGRLNERLLKIDEPGIYYGQCSELCGARHGYMPINVEVVTPAQFQQWIASKGGKLPGAKPATGLDSTAASPTSAAATPAAAQPQAPQPGDANALKPAATNQAATAQN
jgi:cytochrome c oxidase subunit 2